MQAALTEQKLWLEDFYHDEDMEFVHKNEDDTSEVIVRPAFLCHDVPELVNHITHERNVDPQDCLLKFSIDKGHDKLKFGLNIIEKESPDIEPTKRARYCDGIAPHLHQSTSANRMIILAMVPSIQESYNNLKSILDSLPGI